MASQAPPPESPSGHESDGEFDPSADMLVNDFDDEQTLEEEEENADEADNADEIDDLQREGEMPLEELLAMYGYEANPVSRSSDGNNSAETGQPSTSLKNDQESTPDDTTPSGGFFTSHSGVDEDEDDSDDEDYDEEVDMEDSVGTSDWRRSIQVGEDYQAVVPEGLCKYDDVPAYQNEDKIVWDPSRLPDQEVEEYLTAVRESETTNRDYIPDNEQALLLLHQCGHKPDEAVRRRKMMSPKPQEQPTPWSEEECSNFEEGFKKHYKDFQAIQHEVLSSRTVAEIVQFYYKWKKTERHDEFVRNYRIEKKKYALHPTTTDYMDRFVEEMDCAAAGLPSPFVPYKQNPNHSMIPSNFGGQSSKTVISDSSVAVNGLSKEEPVLSTNTDMIISKTQSNGNSPVVMTGNGSSSSSSMTESTSTPSNLPVVSDNSSVVNCK